jgi:hypothetical protein
MPLSGKSAGVSSIETDLTFAAGASPTGIPAGVVGTAIEGPAFVPVTVGSYQEFTNRFGDSNGEIFGPLAAREWLTRSQALTYVRVLGAGDGKERNTDGPVTNAGFMVGANQIQPNGIVSKNPYAASTDGNPPLGRTYFLGCYMSETNGSTIFSDAGIQGFHTASAIVRGVIMAASGVVLTLSSAFGDINNTPIGLTVESGQGGASDHLEFAQRGDVTGSVRLADGDQDFVLLLNGLIDNPGTQRSFISASFRTDASNYISKVLNTNPYMLEERGHYLYTHYDIDPGMAVPTGSGILVNNTFNFNKSEQIAFITTGSLARDTGNSTTSPNYENFRDRYRSSRTPFFISQKFGGTAYDLFRIHARTDGSAVSGKRFVSSERPFKITIKNLIKSNNDADLFGSFDLIVRSRVDTDRSQEILEEYNKLSLNPASDRYIGKIIGDQNTFFDFDKANRSQRLVVDGDYPNKSKRIRVEISTNIKNRQVADNALPVGFRGPDHLVTSGSQALAGVTPQTMATSILCTKVLRDSQDLVNRASEPPIPYRENVYTGLNPKKALDARLTWGVQTVKKTNPLEPNRKDTKDTTVASFTRYFPRMATSNINFSVGNNPGVADSGGIVLDSDRFNNNLFSLEHIRVRTGSDGLADVNEWLSASYVRNGNVSEDKTGADKTGFTRAFSVNDLATVGNRKYAKFTTIMQGGFDGLRIFNEDAYKLRNSAASREMDNSTAQGGIEGPTVAAYRKAIDIVGNTSDVDIKLLAIPGLRDTSVTDYAISAVENRFDALYIMDIEERDTLNQVVTGSEQVVNVTNTVADFLNRGLDTSFAAAYFPDLTMTDPATRTAVDVPPSVSVLGAFALNDAVGHPWFAPAGFTRGAISATQATVDLIRDNLDDLYEADINPITDFPGKPLVVWGQKTLLSAATSLDRVNVRRLLIEIRRRVRTVANSLLFEPNREETLSKFSSLVNPIMQSIQEQSGVDRFKVVIDTSTTTQADIENNTIRGKIFLQPTRTAEFISLDFTLENPSADVS